MSMEIDEPDADVVARLEEAEELQGIVPIATFQGCWYLDEDGDQCFSWIVNGKIQYAYVVGELQIVIHKLIAGAVHVDGDEDD